jgi:hypothetical protein
MHQRWYTQSGGPERFRSGNYAGWHSSFPNGTFKVTASTGDIPTVNNGQLTIQKNGTNVATFTANQSTASTANITVPTKTSELTNNSNYVSDASYVHTDNNFTASQKTKLDGMYDVVEIEKSLAAVTDWANTGIYGPNLDTGTYLVQVYCGTNYNSIWGERWSGVMSWYNQNTNNTDSDEIWLHNAGHASNGRRLYLRVKRDGDTVSGTKYLTLQYAFSHANTTATTIKFTFRRIF